MTELERVVIATVGLAALLAIGWACWLIIWWRSIAIINRLHFDPGMFYKTYDRASVEAMWRNGRGGW